MFNHPTYHSMSDENVLGYEIMNEPWCGDVYEDPTLLVPGVADRRYLQPMCQIFFSFLPDWFLKVLSIQVRSGEHGDPEARPGPPGALRVRHLGDRWHRGAVWVHTLPWWRGVGQQVGQF